MRTQNWTPDTCGCTIEEQYEETSLIGTRVIRKCVAHASVPDDQLYGVIFANPDGENKRKNQIERALLGLEGTNFGMHESVVQPDGSTTVQFKNNISVNYSFTGSGADRVLNVTITGISLTNNQKNAATTWATTKFGVGKVVITN